MPHERGVVHDRTISFIRMNNKDAVFVITVGWVIDVVGARMESEEIY